MPQPARLPDFPISDVDDVAAEGYQACMHGEVMHVPGLLSRVATVGGRVLPKGLLRRLAGVIGRSSL